MSSAYNTVTVETDDGAKRLSFEELLTSGSNYRVVVSGGAGTVDTGHLIVILPDELAANLPPGMKQASPVVAAQAALSTSQGSADAEGTLSTNTDVLQTLARRMCGETLMLPCVLHSTTYEENVATGWAKIRLVNVTSGASPTGAAVLFKGERGERGDKGEKGKDGDDGKDGVGITNIEHVGSSGGGDNVYKVTYGDGRTAHIVCPIGPRGRAGKGVTGVVQNADMTLTIEFGDGERYTTPFSVRGVEGKTGDGTWVRNRTTGKWHYVEIVENDYGEMVFEPSDESTDLRPPHPTYLIDDELDETSDHLVTNRAVARLVPAEASQTNQLADKEFVNHSIATSTATFKGTFNTLAELKQVPDPTKNDYGYVVETPAGSSTKTYRRYKHDGTDWKYEYALTVPELTAAQWAAINSEITAAKVADIAETKGKLVNVSGFWVGTKAQYDAATKTDKTIYFVTEG